MGRRDRLPNLPPDLVVKNRDRLKKSAKRRASPSPSATDPDGGVADPPPAVVEAAEEESDPPNPPVIEIEEERLDPTVAVAGERQRRFGWAPKVQNGEPSEISVVEDAPRRVH
ncbi:hypothetical protein QJS10_CPB15g00138 [Acorus calamus]|uniref:Uncharacterized protein n=1 Tax=Acorus calamus TaxID=4465 RepID=A0AAV9D6M4_ACOCL|nr:hypothetical protein QJS10_CPB15g00138 [Acorus calamus]